MALEFLTAAERSALDHFAHVDALDVSEYHVARGPLSGHAFADNRYSMVADLTARESVDADSTDEADRIVSARPLAPGEIVFCADDHHDTLCVGTCPGCRADCSGVMFARESATVAEWEAAGAGYPKEWEGI